MQLLDNRPEAREQAQLQEQINNSPRVMQLQAYQQRADQVSVVQTFGNFQRLNVKGAPTSMNHQTGVAQFFFRKKPATFFTWVDQDTGKEYEQVEVQIDNRVHLNGHGEDFYIVSDKGKWAREVVVEPEPEMESASDDDAEIARPRTRAMHHLSDGESESEDPSIVWRSLRKNEEVKVKGVRPPDGHDPDVSASAHISAGSKAKVKSAWVSTSRSRKVATAWASESDGRVAKLKIPEDADPDSVFDLTNPNDAHEIFPSGKGSTLNTAKASQEVVIKGGLGPEQVLALFEARKITVKEYEDIKRRMASGEKIIIDGKKVYAVFRTRSKATGSPAPRLLLELPDEEEDDD